MACEVRGYRPADRRPQTADRRPQTADGIRVTHGTTTVQVALASAAGGARTILRFDQEHLARAEVRER
ncbi:hypothetical protein [Streptomyces poriferorum]|uniref:hypothetical protein n=1 Tax=Streptomyces poriferorum TaxID=2798799 RepID=UPI001F164185|nr:hypothetical protein [Streptomyces poriferorum]